MSVIGSGGVEQTVADIEHDTEPPAKPGRRSGARRRDGLAGWLFMAPAFIVVVIFVLLPVFSALWVSVSDWTGKGSPLTANFVGVDNYQTLLTKPGLAQRDLGTALRNNMYYVFLVVPLQTVLALVLAIVLNRRRLKGKGFFRSAFYFPSVTSSVAISIVFLFLFNASGVVNAVLAWFGINGPNWFADPRGVGHILLGLVGVDTENPPSARPITTSWGSAGGSGGQGHRWRCAPSLRWPSGPPPAPSCCCSWPRCRTSPRTSRRPPRWMAPWPGSASGRSPCQV